MSGGGKGSGSSTIRISRSTGEGKSSQQRVGAPVKRPRTIVGGAKAAGRKKW